MKSKRILQLILLVLIVVFVAAAGFIYTKKSSEIQRQTALTNSLNQKQAAYNKGLVEKAALNKTADDLAAQLAGAKTLFSGNNFLSSATSIFLGLVPIILIPSFSKGMASFKGV